LASLRSVYSVPDLQFDYFALDFNSLSSELGPYSEVVVRSEAFVGELQEQTGLADARVPDDDELNR
jgi:hypothetical protein